MFKLVAKKSESKNEVNKKDTLITCKLRVDDITPPELYTLLHDNLDKYKELEIDYKSFESLNFKNISRESLDLILHTVYSHFVDIPFSLKSGDNEGKKWVLDSNVEDKVKSLVEAQKFVKKLQECPPNLLVPESFVEYARDFLKGLPNIKISEIKGKELADRKLNLISTVGQASINPPRLLIIEYKPADSKFKVLVGKGVCYDSGGLNVKTGVHMATMKFDMSGGAVSLGTVFALAKNNSKQNLVVLIPLVENSIAGNAYKPDDVIVSYSGKSIEIDNTDAEGRLILADSLAYGVKEYEPEEIISIATLTGAIGYALGYKYAGAWATEEGSWDSLYKSSIKAGDWIWRMPLDDYYLKGLTGSRVADIKNSAKTGAGGASRAACFLKEFVGKTPYIHLDIANVAHGENNTVANAPLLRTLYYYLFK